MSHLDNLSLRELRQLAYAKMRLPIVEEQERQACRGGLIHFVRYFWHILEPKTKLVEGWPLEAICLPYQTKITTSEGEKCIGDIVESGWEGNILSLNHRKSELEWKPVVSRMKSQGRPLLRVETSRGGVLQLTDNHPLYVLGRGYVRADEVKSGDRIYLHSMPEDLSGPTEWQPILRASVLFGSSLRGSAYKALARLQALWEVILSTAFPPNRRFLFNAVLGGLQDNPREHYLPALWRKKDLEPHQAMSCMLDKVPEGGWVSQVRWMRGKILSSTINISTQASSKVRKDVWGFLQFKMLWKGQQRGKQSLLCQWKACRPLSAGILDYAAQGLGARWKSLFSLFGRTKEIGCAPYRPEYKEQRAMEFGGSVPKMPLPATRSFNEGNEPTRGYCVGTAVVRSIVREAQIPKTVYNIEVLDNHNYFAEGILTHNCEHLEAVTFGEITKLLMNVPPGFMKSLLTDVLWPAWEWGPMNMPHLRYVTFSYSVGLTMRDNGRFKELMISPEYQKLWGKRFGLRKVGEERVTNDKTGWKFASSVGGVGTGERGDRVILDDPHNVKESESDVVRSETVRWFKESMSNRLNDIERSAVVVIMQRVHEEDVSGVILSEFKDYCHLMIPMRFEPTRYPFGYNGNDIGWLDTRTRDGDYAWPERFPPGALAQFERQPYMWAGQYQQSPTPRGGGIIKEESWQLWPSATYPQCELVLGSLDTASTEKEQNDASALTIWGVFRDGQGSPKAILLYAWEGRLEINDLVILVGLLCSVEKRPDSEYQKALALFNRGDEQTDTLYRVPVDRLLVENKNNGISVAHELYRLFGHSGNFAIELIDPKKFGDKVARIIACEPMFADEMVYAPDRAFAERVINNVAAVPKTSKWDTPDSVSQALLYMRKTGLLLRKDEQARVTHEELLFKPQLPALY